MALWSNRFYLFFSWGGILFAAVFLCITTVKLIPSSVRQRDFQKERMVQLEKQLADTEHAIEVKRKFLDKLNTNPAFLERVARERLKYVDPDDVIVHVDEQ